MVSAAEQLAANLNFGAFAKAEELKKRIWFTLAALVVYRLGTYIPIPGINPVAFAEAFKSPVVRHPRHVQHVRRRRRRAHGDLRAQHHALHLRLHHHAADDERGAHAGGAEEGRRAGPQADQPVHALPDRGAGRVPGLRHRLRPRGLARRRRAGGDRSGLVLPHLHGGDAGRRHHVPDVARRADHRARRRQRHLAHHHGGHRRRPAERARRPARAVAAGRHLLAAADRAAGADAGGGRRHRLHRARPAPPAGPVSQAADGQPHVPGRCLASAAEAQLLGRHPADLRLLAAAAADHGGAVQRRIGPEWLNAIVASLGRGQPLYLADLRGADRVLRLLLHRRSSSIRRRRPTTCASTAASCRASGPAPRRPSTSTTC